MDLENCKIFVNQGKGSKDRYVLFGKSFATALRTHIAAHPQNRWLFQTRRCGKFSTRRVSRWSSCMPSRRASRHAPHLPPPGDHLADQATRGWRMPNCSSSRGMPGGRPWRSTSTSPWMGQLADKYQAAMKDVGL